MKLCQKEMSYLQQVERVHHLLEQTQILQQAEHHQQTQILQ